MRRLAVLVLAAAVLVPAVSFPGVAAAQGDWEVKRDPFDRRVIAGYKGILAKNPGDQAALKKLVTLYKRHRTIALLIEEYEKELEKSPKNVAARIILGHVLLEDGRTDEALAAYEQAAALEPKNAVAQLALGELYRRAGKNAEARAALEQALAATTSKNVKKDVLRQLAELALGADDIAGARQFFDQYIALDPKDVQARIDLGDALLRHNEHDAAVEAFKQAEARLKSDPARRVEVVARIGAAYEAAGKEEVAVREYRRAIGMVGKSYFLRRELTERIIDVYRRRQELDALITHHEKEWTERSRGHFEWDVLARLYEETGAQEKAIEAYRHATRKAPHELDTQRRLISLLEHSGREDEAIKQYEVVIKVAPGEPRFQLELAQRYWERGDQKKALAMLEQIARRFPGDGGVHAAIADLYTRWGKEDRALDAYVRLTQIEPDEVSHLVNLGEQYYQRGDKDKAVAVWKRIIRRKTAANYGRLGEVYAEHDMLKEALEMFAKSIQLEPKNPERYKGRAAVYERQRRWDDAISDWDKVLELLPATAANRPARRDARRRIVNVLKRAGGNTLDRRMNAWSTAFRKDPPDLDAGWFLFEGHLKNNQYHLAGRVLERMLANAPQDLEVMQELVKVYRRQLEYDKAVALLLELAKLSPGREREYYTEISEIKTENRQDDEAIKYARLALEKSPNDPVAHQRLAERYQDMQNFAAAIAAYEKAIEFDKRNFKVYFTLAELYKYTNQLDRAAELYREILRRSTDDEVLHKAGREAIDLEEMLGTLGRLEQSLAPLAFTYAHKQVYRRILVELYGRYVPHVVDDVRRGDEAARTAAHAELERLGAHGLKPLLEALNDSKDVAQQRIAVAVLGYLGNKGAAAPLVRLARDPSDAEEARRRRIGTLLPTLDWDVRVEALVAAGRLGDPRTLPELTKLADHREVAMREAATYALGMTGDRKALAPILARLDDRNESVQAMACLSLARLGVEGASARLLEVVGDRHRQDLTRAACAFALGSLRERKAVPVLGDLLASGNGELQRLAAWALGAIGDKRAVAPLLSAYFSRHAPVRETIAWALHRLDRRPSDALALPELTGYPMRNGKFDASAAVADLPGQLAPPPLDPDLILGHEAELVASLRAAFGRHRDLIVRVLVDLDQSNDALSLGPLTAAMATAPPAVRTKLGAATGRIGAAIAGDLVELTSHRDPTVRALALGVLAKIDAASVKPAILAALDDGEASVRRAAMQAAARFAARSSADAAELARAVATRLGADDWALRRDAAEVLAGFGASADGAGLIRALGDDNAYVRESAALSLGRLRHAEAVAALAELLADPVPEVRVAAVRSLAAIGERRVYDRIEELSRSDEHPGVRKAAARAVANWKK